MKTRGIWLALAVSVLGWVAVGAQNAPLKVLDAAPKGEIDGLEQANELRLTFSEPMIALGRADAGKPAWLTVTPAMDASFRWFGTSTLVITPNPDHPLPLSTRYTVTVARGAASASGQTLAAPYAFSFTTPTVKLTDANAIRPSNTPDGIVGLALGFNQAVRPADILAHVTVRYQPHQYTAPTLSADARARMAAIDPNGPAAFDAKVAAARAVAASTAPVGIRAAGAWLKNPMRWLKADQVVLLETTTPVAPGARLQVTLDAQAPSPSGSAVPGRAQNSAAMLPPVFFVTRLNCAADCEPSGYRALNFTTAVSASAVANAVTVMDVTAAPKPVTRGTVPKSSVVDQSESVGLDMAGYGRQAGLTRWEVRVAPTLKSADGQTLGYPWVGVVQTSHDRPATSFGDGHGVWESSSGPLLPFYARNYRSVQQWTQALTASGLMPRLRELTVKNFEMTPTGPGTRRSLTVQPDLMQSHGFDLSAALKNGLGLVWAAVGPGEIVPGSKALRAPAEGEQPRGLTSTVVQVTNLGLTVKDGPAGTLVFATRLDNGAPEPDVTVSLVNLDNETMWKGKTNADGVAMAPPLDLRKTPKGIEDPLRYSSFRFIAIGEKNGDTAYVASDWTEGISPWEFDLNFNSSPSAAAPLLGAVFTDRGVYRTGEEMHFKTILRKNDGAVTLLPAGTKAYVTVTDNRGRDVDTRTITLNKWSGADWAWTVPAAGSLGTYSVRVALDPPAKRAVTNDTMPPDARDTADADGGDENDNRWERTVSTSWLVAAYRRPDFRVDTTLAAAAPVAGQPLAATVSGRYLFGNPMAKRPVRWTLERDPEYGAPSAVTAASAWKDFSFGYVPQERARTERTASATTNLDAAGALSVTLATAKDTDIAYRYAFTGEVEDVSRQRIAGASSVVVYPAPFLIGLKLPDYFAPTSTGTSVSVAAVDLDGRARAGVNVKLALRRIQWNSVRNAEGGGFYAWDSTRVEVPVGEWTVTTANAPVAQPLPVPEGGFYELTATATDAAGHTTRTDTSFYGTGAGYTAWKRFDDNRIELKPERDTLSPGDTAHVMILSPWESATALLTVEREGVRSYKRFALTSTQQTVDVPIGANDIPNVFVSVLLVRGRTSSTFGEDGSDPGKPQFRLGYTELHVEDSSKALSVAVKADRDEYRPQNTAKVSVTTTDNAGKPAPSEVTLWAVDYGVLSLTGYTPPDLKGMVYTNRALRVSTADSRERLVSRRVITPKGDGEGGGGGADAGPGAMRRDFRPLAFWLGSVETNRDGKATADVKLPDSLTTYHIMAVAGDAASRFGASTTEIRVAKPLTLLPSLPRFLTVGDKASIGASVSSTLTQSGTATVTIKSLDPSVLTVAGSTDVSLEAKGTAPVRFDATAVSAGVARLQITAKLGGNNDAFETTLPVVVPAPVETFASVGQTRDRATVPVAPPLGVSPTSGGLTIGLSSSALAGLGEGARYIDEYPFACAEQKASRALVLALAADLGRTFGLSNVAPADYKTLAGSLLKSLENYQCPNGSFALWPGQCAASNAYLTAYVLDVMHTAAAAGIPEDKTVVDEALQFLERATASEPPAQVQAQPVWLISRAYATKILAEHGRNQDANITRVYAGAAQLPTVGLSYLADALAAANDKGPRYQDVVRRLTNATRVDSDRAHTESPASDALQWIWVTPVSTTAIALDGFARRGDNPTLTAPMVRWLLDARENGRWSNTHENGRVLASLVRYYQAYEADAPAFKTDVTLGARHLGSVSFAGRSTDTQTMAVAMKDVIASAGSDLTFAVNGTGTLFYSTRLQVRPQAPPPAAAAGFTVTRRFETFVEGGDGVAQTTYHAGDLVRVVLTIDAASERRFVAVTDALPAGFEAVDGFFRTTAADLAREASIESNDGPADGAWVAWWLRGGFDRVEKFDDHVELFATRLGTGRHEFSYLVRATTSGTFTAAGTRAEEMYAPSTFGRAAAATVIVK